MRKITCQSCKNRYGDYGLWVIFDRVIICETCRLAVIEYCRLEFDLGHPLALECLVIPRLNRK